jgi:hypothetical protein
MIEPKKWSIEWGGNEMNAKRKVEAFANAFFRGIFFCVLHSALLICHPSVSTVSGDAGIETRAVATSALAVRRLNR